MPLWGLIAVFIVLPIAELYLIYQVGDMIGILWTLALLAADSVLGSLLLRNQGRTIWLRFNEALASGRMPHREVQEGVAVIFGGAFLITPGFITDICGLALLFPPTRALVLRLARKRLAVKMATRVARGGAPGRGRAFDVEGTASEHPPEPLPPRLEQ